MQVYENEATTICGTPEYLAPEIIQKKGYGKAVDWWTLGSIIYEMLVGIPPFYEQNRMELFSKIQFSDPKYPKFLMLCQEKILKIDQGLMEQMRLKIIHGFRMQIGSTFLRKCINHFTYQKQKEIWDQRILMKNLDPESGPGKKFEGFSFETETLEKQRKKRESNLMEIEEEQGEE